MEVVHRTVTAQAAGQRLDRLLAELSGRSRNQVQRWIRDGLVLVNGRPGKISSVTSEGDTIEYRPPPPARDPDLLPEEGPLSVLHEEEEFVVLDKPAGLAVHPGAGRSSGTLVNRLVFAYPEIEGVAGRGRPGIVHRLDMDTSGVMVIARTDAGYQSLSRQFAERQVDKEYAAIVYGRPPGGRIEAPVGRHPRDRKRMAVRGDGRPALTEYEVVSQAAGLSLLRIALLTGRTHQIRVHLKHIGYPLVGDPVYGEARWKGLDTMVRSAVRAQARPALHALRLSFDPPGRASRVSYGSLLAEDLERLWSDVGGGSARALLDRRATAD